MMAARLLALSDPGGVRPVAARWTISADLILESATHLGAGAGDTADMVLLRDARTGGPLLPGTSIAGALRSHLADVLGGYRSAQGAPVARLFGGPRGDDVGAQSPLIVFDSIGRLPGDHAVEIRDGVQIDPAHGTAEDHKKFDLEVLPAGTSFPIRIDLVVPKLEDESELVSHLVVALSGLSCGDIALGARRSRGLGAVRATNWRTLRYDLTSGEGWMTWLLSDWKVPLAGVANGATDVREACERAYAGLSLAGVQDSRRRFVVVAEISSIGGLLVRSAPTGPDAPDASHLQSAGRSVLPGTAVAGVLRNQALRITRIARDGKDDAERWVDRLFGRRMAGVTATGSPSPCASRLRLSESVVEQGTRSRPSRVRIDRFTQGVVRGALFDEEPEHGGRVRLRIELREPEPGELGLLLLVLKDLLTGEVAIGGTSAVGRGRFEGTAALRLEDGRTVNLDPVKPPDPIVDQAIGALRSSPVLGGAP
jgi:CRISPR/Cas system CSM-associated protein Csm3 (group 7 of RAMP superfamily)